MWVLALEIMSVLAINTLPTEPFHPPDPSESNSDNAIMTSGAQEQAGLFLCLRYLKDKYPLYMAAHVSALKKGRQETCSL